MRPRRARWVGRAAVAGALLVAMLGGEPAVDPASGAIQAATGSGGPAPVQVREELATGAATAIGPGRRAPSAAATRVTPDPATPVAPASLVAPPGSTTLVSATSGGGFPSGASTTPSASSSGRYVAFASTALNLVPGGSSGASAVFVRDRSTGTTVALPVPGGGPVPKGASATAPSISADGTVVTFVYQTARQVVAGYSTVVAWDRSTGTTTPVSTALPVRIDRSREPAVSADGRYVAFTYDNGNGTSDVYRYDRVTGSIVLVSAGPGGSSAGGTSSLPSISGDGSVVAFASSAGPSLVGGATGTGVQVFARDLNAGSTQLVSVGAGGAAPNNPSSEPSVSDDGRYVAFTSTATNLVGGTSSAPAEVYLRDRQASSTVLVSAVVDGTPNPYASRQPAISRDGRMVAYVESQPSLAAALLVRQVTQLFLYDVPTQRSVLISVNLSGQASPSVSADPSVAGDGRYVAFASTGPDLVSGDANGASDVFIRDLPPVPKLSPAVIDFGTRAVGVSPGTAAGVLANSGWAPLTVKAASIAGANPGDFSILADGCAGIVLHGGEACTVTVGFAPAKAGARSATLQIADSYTGSPRTAALTGRGSSAKIVLDPPLGPPGIVVIATGSGFPAGAQIALSWSIGITPVMPVVTANAKGGFEVPVLVMRNDRVGQRDLVATWVGGPQFPALQTPMLVTIASAEPPRFLGGGSLQSLVFRG